MIMNYSEIYEDVKNVLSQNLNKTRNYTLSIKEYFHNKFENKYNVYSSKSRGYLYDISLLTFKPGHTDVEEYELYAAIESELGGKSASGYSQVEKNVLEDYQKLIIANSSYKIMIAIYSLNMNDNTDSVNKRIEKMFEIYQKSKCNSSLLIIMILGVHTKKRRQIQICTKKKMNGFIFEEGKDQYLTIM